MIRKYEEQDTDALVSIWREATAVAHTFMTKEFVDEQADALRNIYLKHAETWVTEIDGEVVGFVAMVENEVAGLFLRSAFHGQGLGRAMVEFAFQQKGPLRVEVFEKNAVGRRFYEAFGFRGSDDYVHEATGEKVLKLTYAPD